MIENIFNLVLLKKVLVKHIILLISIAVISFVLSFTLIYFFVDEKYTSTSIILPIEGMQMGVGIGGLSKAMSSLPMNILSGSKKDDLDLYFTIIFSQTCLDSVAKRFSLVEDYDIDTTKIYYRDELRKYLISDIKCEITKKNAFSISVNSFDPVKAANMVNFIVQYTNEKIIRMSQEKSRSNRLYIEGRYNEIKTRLIDAENKMFDFQKKNGIVEFKEQTKGSILAMIELESELIRREILLNTLISAGLQENPTYKSIEKEYNEIKRKLANIKMKSPGNELLFGTEKISNISEEYLRHYRNLEINTKLLEIVTPLYEQIKFEEFKDVPVMQIVDYGIPHFKKTYPPRILFALLTSCITLLIVVIVLTVKSDI